MMMIALEPQNFTYKLLCPTGAKINGELFLDFAEDEELVKRLNLPFAFERLVKKKAKEVRNKRSSLLNLSMIETCHVYNL